MADASVIAATITASVAVVVAIGSGLLSARRERVARAAERRERALVDLQDAALGVRRVLQRYVVEARPGELVLVGDLQRRIDDADGRFDVLVVRVPDAQVRAAAQTWREVARGYYSRDETVTASDEVTAWSHLNTLVGAELQRDG